MGRQLFLHHYLPAHLASALVTGALVEFVFNIDPVVDVDAIANGTATVTKGSKNQAQQARPIRSKIATQSLMATWAAVAAIMAVIVYGFLFFAPLTYGNPGLTVEQVVSRKWLNYDLHFAK